MATNAHCSRTGKFLPKNTEFIAKNREFYCAKTKHDVQQCDLTDPREILDWLARMAARWTDDNFENIKDADDAFEEAVTADYDAEAAVEHELVLRLASALWRLRRATGMLFEAVTAEDGKVEHGLFGPPLTDTNKHIGDCFLRLVSAATNICFGGRPVSS